MGLKYWLSILSLTLAPNVWASLQTSDVQCLMHNVYHEARGEPFEGKLAVVQVTMNRLKSKKWGGDVCSVVFSPNQFSWTRDKVKMRSMPDKSQWAACYSAIDAFIKGARAKGVGSSKFYHTKQVKPRWSIGKLVKASIGNHLFFDEV